MDDLQVCLNTTLPQALADLNQSHKNIEQIASYCKKAYESESDQTAVFAKTQLYVKDALSNVAYHIHTVGLHITNFLQLQANEIDKLDLQISTLTDRVKSAHDTVGTSGFRTMEAIKGSGRIQKNRKLDDHELPANARPVPKFVRQQINLKALDNVGIDLSGNKGNDNFGSTLQPSVSIQAPPPVLSSPPSLAPPSFGSNLPFQPPPPMAVLQSQFEMPPPPPPDFDAPPPFDDGHDLPPPPPPRD